MALTTIVASKDAERAYQPLLLVTLHWRAREFGTDTYLRFANRPINSTETGIPTLSYKGNSYSGRLLNPQFVAWQTLSANGMGQAPQASLEISDDDHDLWNTYEGASGKGFRGARLTIRMVFYDPNPADYDATNGPTRFSTDEIPIFQGIIQQPQSDDNVLRLTASSMLNLQFRVMPQVRIQKRCPWIHPETASELAEAEDFDSAFYPCGRYMLNGSEDDHSACGHTRAECKRLGRLDDSNVGVGRFAGIVYQVRHEYEGKNYISGQKMKAVNVETDAKYGDYVPYVYGCGWVQPPVLTVYGEANYIRYELLVCYGETVYQVWDSTAQTWWAPGEFDKFLTEAVATPIPYIGGRWKLVLNEHEIQMTRRSTDASYPGYFQNAFWNFVTGGQRNGTACRELGLVDNPDLAPSARKPLGDPYGSLTVIYACMTSDVASSEEMPSARLLMGGPLTRRVARLSSVVGNGTYGLATLDTIANNIVSVNPYGVIITGVTGFTEANGHFQLGDGQGANPPAPVIGPPGTFTLKGLTTVGTGTGGYVYYMGMDQSPVWAIFDLLLWAGYTYADLDLDSFIDTAVKCAVKVAYTDISGHAHAANDGHARFKCNLILREPTSIATLIEGVLNACNCILRPGETLSIKMREPLASQQPASMVSLGSNDGTGYAAKLTDGTSGTGYFAYVFDESNIAQSSDGRSTLVILERSLEDSPNCLSFQFSDEENQYRIDSVTVVDERDIARTGQAIPASLPVLGVPNTDQAQRVAWINLALRSRGNPRYNANRPIGTSGTWVIRFRTTTRIIHLKIGDLVGLRSKRYELGQGENPPQAFRIIEIKPEHDFSSVEITAEWHEDLWHTLAYGTEDEIELYSDPGHNKLLRGPWAWQPYKEQAPATDPWSPLAYTFGVSQTYTANSDGSIAAWIMITGYQPVNEFADGVGKPYVASPPYAISGGTLALGKSYYVTIVAKDGTPFAQTEPQQVTYSVTLESTGTNQSIRFPEVIWHGGTGYLLYAGTTPQTMTFQAMGETQPAGTIDLTSLAPTRFAPPDGEADHFFMRAKKVRHSGVWGQPVDYLENNTLSILESGWTVNQWAGRVLSILGNIADASELPVWNFTVVSNTSDTLTFDPAVNLTTLGVEIGDAAVMRTQATGFGTDYIEDSTFANTLAEPHQILWAYGDSATNEICCVMNTSWFVAGDSVRVFGAYDTDGNLHGMNGSWTITKPNEYTCQLTGSSWVPYYDNGTGFMQIVGMRPDDEIGQWVYIIGGTGAGQSRRVVDNTATRLTVSPHWDTAPDATSIFLVEDENWLPQVETDTFSNKVSPNDATAQPITLKYPVDNKAGQMYRVEVGLVDGGGTASTGNPWREIWMTGYMGASTPSNLVEKDRATFGIGIGAPQTIGNDLTNHFMVRLPDGGGTFIEAIANCKTWDAGEALPLIIDIEKATPTVSPTTWASVFTTPLTIPAQQITDQISAEFAAAPNNAVAPGDWLRINLLAGSAQTCQDIEVVLRWGE